MIRSATNHWLKDILLLAVGIALLYSILLGHRPLSVPDEARYAEIPREMVVSGNYITPHLNYVKYFEKPALFYWLQAGAIKIWGDSELVVRIPNALMALLGCLLTYGIGRLLFSRQVGFIASLILASSSLYFVMGHLVTIDMTLTTMLTASLFFFLLGTHASLGETSNSSPNAAQRNPLNPRLAYYGFYIFSALAVLTKGLIGIIFPALIIGTWILMFNQWRLLKNIYLPTGILIFLMVTVPWHVLVQIHNPEFLQFYLLDQQFLRYFTNAANRSQPPGFFIPVLALGFLPWTIFIVQAFIHSWPRRLVSDTVSDTKGIELVSDTNAIHSWPRRWQDYQQNKLTVFLLLWPLLIFTFFSFSRSQLIPYILPVFPPLAVIVSKYLTDQWNLNKAFRGTQWGYSFIPVLIFVTGIGAYIVNHYHHLLVLGEIKHELLAITLIWIISSALATYCIWQHRAKAAFTAMLIGSFLVYFFVLIAMPKADTRSIKPLAMTIKAHLQPGDEVVTYENYYQDLPFYLQRRITIVDWQNELEFGMQHQDTTSWMIPQTTFWQLWQSSKTVYMLTDDDTYATLKKSGQYKLYLLAQTPGDVLLVNREKL